MCDCKHANDLSPLSINDFEKGTADYRKPEVSSLRLFLLLRADVLILIRSSLAGAHRRFPGSNFGARYCIVSVYRSSDRRAQKKTRIKRRAIDGVWLAFSGARPALAGRA